MHSMTGYGRGQAAANELQITVDLRTVNHRYLDIRTRFAGPLAEHAHAAEDLIKAQLIRGRVELIGKCEGPTRGTPELDVHRARAAFAALGKLRDELCPGQELPLSLLSTVPELFTLRETADPQALAHAALTATRAALQQLLAMREAEGAALQVDLNQRVTRMRELARELSQHVPRIVADYRKQLQGRIAALLPGGLSLDPGRLEHEVALFADRADIAEELTRLDSHCQQFASLLQERQQAVGRRLDFLLQEMGREANTIGAKVADITVTATVVELKAELERMREQAQNVL